jgi:hypothetical protein
MSTLQVTNINSLTASTPPVINDSAGTQVGTFCRAWINYNGSTPGIRASFNVSSVTKNSTGNYTMNFTTAMVDGNYSISGFADVNGAKLGFYGPANGSTLSTGSVNVCAATAGASSALSDAFQMHVAIFR